MLGQGDGQPRDVAASENVRHDVKCSAVAVIAELVDITAVQAEEAFEHARRMMQTAGARPSVGATIDGFVAVFGFDAPQFGLDDLEGLIPADGDERLRAALAVCARPAPQKAFANVRLIDPQAVP